MPSAFDHMSTELPAMPAPMERMPNVLPPDNWCPELKKTDSNAVFPYQPNEIAISRTEAGHLANDVVMIGNANCRYLVIRDFGVDWRHLKSIAKSSLLTQIPLFEANKSLHFQIVGYSDCVGGERNNLHLRIGRARNVFHLLGPNARSRVFAVKAAPPHTYLTDNSTVAARAETRAAVIEIFADPSGGGTI